MKIRTFAIAGCIYTKIERPSSRLIIHTRLEPREHPRPLSGYLTGAISGMRGRGITAIWSQISPTLSVPVARKPLHGLDHSCKRTDASVGRRADVCVACLREYLLIRPAAARRIGGCLRLSLTGYNRQGEPPILGCKAHSASISSALTPFRCPRANGAHYNHRARRTGDRVVPVPSFRAFLLLGHFDLLVAFPGPSDQARVGRGDQTREDEVA